jgi:membrane-associated phospholipid phosphatase
MTKIATLVDGFARAYPMFIVLYSFMNGLLNNNEDNLLFGFFLLGGDVLNNILKRGVFRPLMGNKNFPILGYGCRPAKSTNTGLFKDNTLSKTYGMPSGHAQISWMFTIYWSMKIWNDRERSDASKMIPILILLVFSIGVTYSRVFWAKCHTIQQVVIGSLIGSGLGVFSYHTLASKKALR